MTDTVPVKFSREELWVLHAAVPDRWHQAAQVFPNCDNLREDIEAGLVMTEKFDVDYAHIPMTDQDCVLINKCISNQLFGPAGYPMGRVILLKAMTARQQLNGMLLPEASSDREHYHNRMKANRPVAADPA